MVSFEKLKELKFITSFLIILKYSLWFLFFTLQGRAIDIAIERKELYGKLIYILIEFILVKLIVMLCDITQIFISEYYKNIEIKYQWNKLFPSNIYKDSNNQKNHLNLLFLDYLPRLFDYKISVSTNHVIMIYVFTISTVSFIYMGFFSGVFVLFLAFFLNYISKNIFIQRIDESQVRINNSKFKILNWVDQYFSAYREISKNWRELDTSSWKAEIYNYYYTEKMNHDFLYLYRNLLSQILVELPFLINTSVAIVCVYHGYLSLTQLFVWIGFSQFMINASNAYAENKVTKKKCNTLNTQISEILYIFKSKNYDDPDNNTITKFPSFEVMMRDGSKNIFSAKPGIYHIKGANGSGKSTLMNVILGYEREQYKFGNLDCSQLTKALKKTNIRLIERDAVIFDCIDDFNSQVCGPLNLNGKSWQKKINETINYLLPAALAKKWEQIFISFEAEYIRRNDKIMSSGEKVILSFMRFLTSWDINVNLLIIDECDSFLDKEKKSLFLESILNISSFVAVYICSHDLSHLRNQEKISVD